MSSRRKHLGPAIILPGLLVAATGVGAGDLATSGFAASLLGTSILWAVVLGAFLKFVLNEGLARWQLATGETLLDGAIDRFGPAVTAVFGVYLLTWSFFVGAALISACGVTMSAVAPVIDDAATSKLVYGALHSAAGLLIAWFGGFRVFERLMAACIAVMFVTVILTAVLSAPDWAAVARGLVVPTIPRIDGGGLTWTVAVMGGVGGTVTILCYGYWIREEGRRGVDDLRACRIDLAVAYAATALFGIAMMIIATGMTLEPGGADLIVALAAQLEPLGRAARWAFLIGAWAAVFSSLLGVWQAVPYLFADLWRKVRRSSATPGTTSAPYRTYLLALAVVPLIQLSHPLREVQKYYALFGAAFIPMLALALLVLNGRTAWVGAYRNRPATVAVLLIALALAVLAALAGR